MVVLIKIYNGYSGTAKAYIFIVARFNPWNGFQILADLLFEDSVSFTVKYLNLIYAHHKGIINKVAHNVKGIGKTLTADINARLEVQSLLRKILAVDVAYRLRLLAQNGIELLV